MFLQLDSLRNQLKELQCRLSHLQHIMLPQQSLDGVQVLTLL